MAETIKKDFTKEIKTAYRNSIEGDAALLVGLVMEITAGNRGKLFVLRNKEGVSLYSYYVSPSAFEHGNIRDLQRPERTIQLGVPEAGVARAVIDRIQEYGLANIGACVIIENLAKAAFVYLLPFVEAIYNEWAVDFQQHLFDQLRAILYGDGQIEDVIATITTQLEFQLAEIVQLYRTLYNEDLKVSDIDGYALTNIARAIIWFIEQEYGADF